MCWRYISVGVCVNVDVVVYAVVAVNIYIDLHDTTSYCLLDYLARSHRFDVQDHLVSSLNRSTTM